ncbi:hypothetical protein AMTRI_Chr06g171980 [Amborella trichopoda]|nr:uncharacterized protein LOC18438084 [Amborella trichopoda]|eukprot:XP_020525418.1 uncharacterized protein LOC18438084 [Amborella trichopoda]
MRVVPIKEEAMGRKDENHQNQFEEGSKALVRIDLELDESITTVIERSPIHNGRPTSMIMKKPHTVIPPHIIAEAISSLRGLDLRWSGPITPSERKYVEQYVLARYPQYSNGLLEEGDTNDLFSLIYHDEAIDGQDDKKKSPRGLKDSSPSFVANHLPDLEKSRLEPSRLLEILAKKSSFPEKCTAIPEIHARNRVLKHCGLTEDEYSVIFTSGHREAMVLIGESYPFFRYNYYMTILEEATDYIREFATYKDSKVVPAPETWLDLRIAGSQLSQYFRRKCKHSPKGLFAYPAEMAGTRYSLHWVSEAHRNKWHVLLDTTSLLVGEDHLNLALHRPDFVLCTLDKIHGHTSKVTCLLVQRRSFDTSSSTLQ